MTSDQLVPWVQLLAVQGVGVGLFHRLLDRFGDPARVFEATTRELASVSGVSHRVADSILASAGPGPREEALRELERARAAGATVLSARDPAYPESLRTIFGPPPLLYYLGDPACLADPCAAMVGTRRATSHGLRTADSLAAELAGDGITIVSGLARGIDSACHEGAIRAGGRTAAVLGSGLGFELSKDRRELIGRILERGAVLSEFPMEMAPRPENFPRRNRIISGLSAATVVVEAGERSGGLITASYAAEQGRDVFAVPGRISDPQSEGCNLLIRDGAAVVHSAADIRQAVTGKSGRPARGLTLAGQATGGRKPAPAETRKKPPPPLTEEEAKIYELLEGESRHVDEVTRGCGMPPHRVAQVLLSLELKGAVVRESGMRYARS